MNQTLFQEVYLWERAYRWSGGVGGSRQGCVLLRDAPVTSSKLGTVVEWQHRERHMGRAETLQLWWLKLRGLLLLP